MHRSRITVTAGLVAALSFAGAGCKEEGPAEQAGKAIDEAAESAEEGVEDLARTARSRKPAKRPTRRSRRPWRPSRTPSSIRAERPRARRLARGPLDRARRVEEDRRRPRALGHGREAVVVALRSPAAEARLDADRVALGVEARAQVGAVDRGRGLPGARARSRRVSPDPNSASSKLDHAARGIGRARHAQPRILDPRGEVARVGAGPDAHDLDRLDRLAPSDGW